MELEVTVAIQSGSADKAYLMRFYMHQETAKLEDTDKIVASMSFLTNANCF